MEKKKYKIGLVPKLIIAIIIGILFGQFLPEGFCRFVVTLSGFFSTFLKFVIPLMILAYVTMGIADLSQGAGKLLLITVALAYGSTLIAGSASYLVSSSLFPHFMSEGALDQIAATADASLTPFFSITLEPVMDTLSAVALAFVMGLCLSSMRGKEMGNSLYNGMSDFSKIIDKVLHTIIIPLLPLYICGTFTDMTIYRKNLCHLKHPLEGIPCCYHHAPDLHYDPVCDRRYCQQKESFHSDQKSDPGIHNCSGNPVFRSYHPGQPGMCKEGWRM